VHVHGGSTRCSLAGTRVANELDISSSSTFHSGSNVVLCRIFAGRCSSGWTAMRGDRGQSAVIEALPVISRLTGDHSNGVDTGFFRPQLHQHPCPTAAASSCSWVASSRNGLDNELEALRPLREFRMFTSRWPRRLSARCTAYGKDQRARLPSWTVNGNASFYSQADSMSAYHESLVWGDSSRSGWPRTPRRLDITVPELHPNEASCRQT